MEKFILNVLQLIVITKVGYSLLKWMFNSKKRSKKSIANKVWQLATHKVHHRLDNALRNQRKVLHVERHKEVKNQPNVIPFRKTK